MITPDYVRLMARYNTWQNTSLTAAADTLDDAARGLDRGAFFGSISATLNHLLWGDRIWLSRFAGTPVPNADGIPNSTNEEPNWTAFKAGRAATDQAIAEWAAGLGPDALRGDLTWFSGAIGAKATRPRALCVAHFLNHQTHHRGQVHAMLTSAGAKPAATDLFAMPGL